MRVVIVGAGDVGRQLAGRLDGHHVVLIDTKPEKLCKVNEPHELEEASTHLRDPKGGVLCIHADGTSRLVLQQLYDPDVGAALLAVTGKDDSNLEAGRLARELGYEPVIAIQHDDKNAPAYHDAHITALDRPLLLADQIERSLKHKGAIIPVGVGLGRGELVEIRLQRTSPVLGRALRHLAPYRWRVAAVFRQQKLIVPTGETVLEQDDRVLLVGDPKILPTVTEYLRLGTPQFPRPYGPNVVTLESAGPDDELLAEAEQLACASGAANLVRGTPGAEDSLPNNDEEDILAGPACKGEVRRSSFAVPPLGSANLHERVAKQRPGVVVAKPRSRGFWSRLFGVVGEDAGLCDRLAVPVLFARNSFPYRRILLPVSYSEVNIVAAEMAIDMTRQLGASLTAMNVDLPEYVSGISEEKLHEEVVPIRRLCELYEVNLDYRHRHGNPIRELVEETKRHDLIVVARRHNRRDNYFDPDVALRVARQAQCSVIVLTIRAED